LEKDRSPDLGPWGETANRVAQAVASTAQPARGPRTIVPTALELLGDEYKPSKRNHDYLRWYDLQFSPLRQSARKVVEVGVETDRSIRMWEEYFPNAEIIGLDIAPHCKKFEGGRRRIFIGDQSNPGFLASVVAETGGEFDVVIDDGLHTPRSMMLTFAGLFPALKRGGVYALEDIIKQPGTVEFFCGLARGINHWPEGFPTPDWARIPAFADQDWLTTNVVGVAFYRYIAFITRGCNPEDNPNLMTPEEYAAKKQALRDAVNATIDAMQAEGAPVAADEVSRRIGGRGLTTIREEMAKRGL